MGMRGIGIVFDIDALEGGFYGSKAWRVFMRNLRPERISGCTLREGDTSATLNGNRREFCIAVSGSGLDTDSIKSTFARCSETGLASLQRRFILGAQLDSEPLMEAGRVDAEGRLVQDEWSRMFHDRCKDCSWGYAPRTYPKDLPKELLSELQLMMKPVVH